VKLRCPAELRYILGAPQPHARAAPRTLSLRARSPMCDVLAAFTLSRLAASSEKTSPSSAALPAELPPEPASPRSEHTLCGVCSAPWWTCAPSSLAPGLGRPCDPRSLLWADASAGELLSSACRFVGDASNAEDSATGEGRP